MNKNQYRRLNLKNGWDLPKGEKIPLTGRKQELVRAYELLVQKPDEDYIREAEERRQKREKSSPVGQMENRISEVFNSVSGPVQKETVQEAAWEAELRDSSDEKWQKKRKRRLQISGVILAAAVIIIGGRLLFGPAILTADISTYEDVPITIEGLTEEPFTVTPAELAKMKKLSIKVDVHEQELAPDEEPELGKAVGPTLETFLDEYGVELDDVRSMKVYSESEKSTAYVHTLEENTIVLSVANGRVPLHEKEAPLRIAVEDTDADAWSGWIRRIVFTMK